MQTPSPSDALEGLQPGARFEFSSRTGRSYVCTLIYEGPEADGAVVRYDGSRRLGRLDPHRIVPGSLVVQGGHEPVLHTGDEVDVRTPSQHLRGTLASPIDEEVAVDRAGRTLRVSIRQVTSLHLLFPVTAFHVGDVFLAESRSGNHYAGRVIELGTDGRRFLAAIADSDQELWLRMSRLEPTSLYVPIPVATRDA